MFGEDMISQIEEMELYIKQLEDENLRLKNSNKSLRTNNKSLLEGNKKLQSQIGKFKSKRIQELKDKIDKYYEENETRMEMNLARGDIQGSQFYAIKIIALNFVKESMKEIGI